MTNIDDDIRTTILEEISAIGGRATPSRVLKGDELGAGARKTKCPASKLALTARLNPAARNQFRALAVDMQTTQEALMAEALNLLFKRYGQPPIA